MPTETLNQKALSADMTVTPGAREFVAVMTSSAVDRDNEVLLPDGMDATDFMKNPVLFLNHDYQRLPIGTVTELKRDGARWLAKGRLAARPESHPKEAVWEPDVVLSLMQQGVIRATSVGFLPTQSPREATLKDKEMFGEHVRYVVARWKLLELSVAPLPANQDALIEMVSKGMVTAEGIKAVTGITIEVPVVAAKTVHQIEVETPQPRRTVVIPVPDLHGARAKAAAAVTVRKAVAGAVARRTGRLWI